MSPSPHSKPQTVHCPVCGLELPAQLKKCPQDGVALTPQIPTDPLVGQIVGGRYEILSVVGRGGMSVVYKARNRAVGSIVAVKTLKQDLISDEELFARFCQEAKAVQMMIHPNVVTVHEFGVTLAGQPFIVMDYLEGQTLADIIEEINRLSVKRFLKIFIQVCEALAHAHAHKIIHRDIKPGNIMLVDTAHDTDVVKLFDFGFAKLMPIRGMAAQALTQQGDVLGTPLYMSPEQSKGKDLDSRTDIYSLGCVMYEALTGRAPIVGENVLDTMQKQISEMPAALETARPDLYIPPALTTVLFKTLEKNPDDRYQSMLDLKRDLEVINNAVLGKARITQSALPGLAKMRRLPEDKGFELDRTVLVIVACVIVVCTAIGALLLSPKQPSAVSGNHAMPEFTGEPKIVWAKYRQAGLEAMQHNNFAEAESLLELALQQAQKTDDTDARAATVYIDLAHTYLRQDKLSDAEKAANKAMSLREKLHETNQRPMGDVFVCFGEISLARDDYKNADLYLEKALAIQQRELGPMHQDLGTTLNELGRALEGQGNFSRAQGYYKQALAIRQTALGPNKLPVAETLGDYAHLLRRMGRSTDAAKAEQRAQQIRSSAGN